MILFFDSAVAERYGLKEAILFQNIAYWIRKNEANEVHFHDGRYWTYNSVEAFARLFPFLTKKQIRTALDNLVENGLVVTGNYNTKPTDRTTWFGLTDTGSAICPVGQMDLPQKANGIAPEGKCISNKILIQNTNKDIYGDFEKFWEVYPKKVNKVDARKAWAKVKTEVDVLIKAVEAQKKSEQWKKDDGRYIPYPATWLRGEQWNNEYESPKEEMSDLFKTLLGGRQ